jgi:hypothetical protein
LTLSFRRLALCLLLGGAIYGAVMGTFGGIFGQRLLQVLYSASKVPLLLVVSFILTLPSFFVLNTLAGLRDDFAHVVRAVLATQAAVALVLASLAPYTLLFYASSGSYRDALVFNLGVFAVASVTGQLVLRRLYRPLILRDRRHRYMAISWLVLYAFVAVQMAWVLRPFVGSPDAPTRFFRDEPWSNAYEVVLRLVWRTMTGS